MKSKPVVVTFVRLLKSKEKSGFRPPAYTIKVNVASNDAPAVLDPYFWLNAVTCREWIARETRETNY